MKISEFLTTKVDTKEDAIKLLSEFVGAASARVFSGYDDDTYYCPVCDFGPSQCKCEGCEECKEKPVHCECNNPDYDEVLKEADAFAKKHSIPFDIELHKGIIDRISSDDNGIWNSSSAYC